MAESLLALEENSAKAAFYDPVETKVEGWTVRVDPKLIGESEIYDKAVASLANHLQRVKFIVRQDRVEQLQKLPIWLELNNEELGSMQYHPGRGWLLSNGHDPRLVKHVHIPRAEALFDPKMWAKHPYVVLHELAHSYHDQVLSFDNEKIVDAFDEAKQKGIYEKVMLFTGAKSAALWPQ